MLPESVLFDLDGTLLDTAPDFILVLNDLRKEYDLAPLPDEVIRNTVSNGARALVTLGFGVKEGDEDFETFRDKLLFAYSSQLGKASRLFPGMEELLVDLEKEGIPWGIVTNKPSRFTIPLLDNLSLSQRCKAMVCADQVSKPKPHPESLLKACDIVRVKPENSIYVGDHQRDIDAGRSAKMTTIAALFGYIPEHDNPDTWKATFQAESANDIRRYILG